VFVRAVWRSRRLVDPRHGHILVDAPTTRREPGFSANDFRNMTRGLFDR